MASEGLIGRAQHRVKDAIRPGFDRFGTSLLAPPRTWPGDVFLHGNRSDKRVALTYDDGPSRPSSEDMLDVLDDLDVSATFFVLGEMVEWYPEILERAHAAGHVIGNHSMYHDRRGALSVRGADHVDRAADVITNVIGDRPALYRPPWGWLTPWEARRLAKRRQHVIGWDVYPDDWRDPETPAEVTAEQVCTRVRPGSIILMHDATSRVRDCAKTESARATRLVAERLRADGYEFVTIPELLGLPAYLGPAASTDRLAASASTTSSSATGVGADLDGRP